MVTFGGHLEPQGRFYHDRTVLDPIFTDLAPPKAHEDRRLGAPGLKMEVYFVRGRGQIVQ